VDIWFLPRDAMLARYMLSSCVRSSIHSSVRPSHAGIVPKTAAKCNSTQTTLYNSRCTLVFRCQKFRRNSDGVTPKGGTKYRWGRFRSAIFDPYLAICLFQKRPKGHSYYGMLIETRMRSIEWRYFRWPWMIHNYPKQPIFDICITCYIYVVVEDWDFKFYR